MPDLERQDLELRRLKPQSSVTPSDRRRFIELFRSMDTNGDEKISYKELKKKLAETQENAPRTARIVLRKADLNDDGYLTLSEFLDCLEENKEVRSLLTTAVGRYVYSLVPVPKRLSEDTGDYGEYEESYSCCPPPFGMIIISIIEIIIFAIEAPVQTDLGNAYTEGTLTAALWYNPKRRLELWRFMTYMFVHNGVFHLIVNLLVQIMLGIPLEMVHKWWRVIIIYVAGVVAGSLGTSISDPGVFLVGASGGVYAILTAHVATIIMNWSQMQFAIAQLAIFMIIAFVDVGTAIYHRVHAVEGSQTIGYSAHLAGALAGLLVGINVLRNLEVKTWETRLWWAALVIYSGLMLAAIIWNIAFPSYFPEQTI